MINAADACAAMAGMERGHLDFPGRLSSPVMATSRHPATRNRCLLYLQLRTFRSPCWTSVVDPKRSFAVTKIFELWLTRTFSCASLMGCDQPLCRRGGPWSRHIQVARQDRRVRRRSKCALRVRNGHRAEFLIVQSARSRTDHGLS